MGAGAAGTRDEHPESVAPAQLPAANMSASSLLRNGVRMSAAFAVNEGALLAVIALSAALVEPRVAALGNALLYLAFSLGCIGAPAAVRRLGDRRALVVGTSAYALYVAAYIAPSAATIPPAALAAGACGALLWTAQGRYFALNARLYAAARRAAASEGAAEPAAEARAVTLFATLFAVLFPAVVAAFKAATSLALLATRGATPPVYAGLAAAALLSVAVMARVRDLPDDNTSPDAPITRTDCGADASPAAAPRHAAACAPAALAAGLCGALTELGAAHKDATLLLMLPTNVAFGLCTAFFPYTVTLLARDALGAAAVGWLYALANVVSAVAAAAFGALAARWPRARPAVFAAGAAAFAAAAAAVFAAAPGGDAAPAPAASTAAVAFLFGAYGIGVAVWQGTCMAFFGEAFPGAAALPAFAALKLHSGLASALAFFILPHAPPRAAAAACVAASLFGFAAYLGAEGRVRAAAAKTVVAARGVGEHQLAGDAEAAAPAEDGSPGGAEMQRLIG